MTIPQARQWAAERGLCNGIRAALDHAGDAPGGADQVRMPVVHPAEHQGGAAERSVLALQGGVEGEVVGGDDGGEAVGVDQPGQASGPGVVGHVGVLLHTGGR